ncbi:MAG: hypothetical protein FWD68_09195 [Alphaproteobacteria bacterium]|nr:hypothetical protein [Alphaproteobacteria bacterium]
MPSVTPDCILTVVCVVAPNFVGAFETDGEKVLTTEPVLRGHIHGLSTDKARHVIAENRWRATVVREPVATPRLVQREESIEVQKGCVRALFYFDEIPSRRAINGRADKATAVSLAQRYLAES